MVAEKKKKGESWTQWINFAFALNAEYVSALQIMLWQEQLLTF